MNTMNRISIRKALFQWLVSAIGGGVLASLVAGLIAIARHDFMLSTENIFRFGFFIVNGSIIGLEACLAKQGRSVIMAIYCLVHISFVVSFRILAQIDPRLPSFLVLCCGYSMVFAILSVVLRLRLKVCHRSIGEKIIKREEMPRGTQERERKRCQEP